MNTPNQTPHSPLISIDNINFHYTPDQPVIRNLSAQITPGKFHILLGPNASGKTTLLKILLGCLIPQSGKITLNNTPIQNLSAQQRAAAITYVPQRSSATFAFTVRQVIQMARLTLPKDPQAVDHAITAANLQSLAHRPFLELSTGQQQRVLLARAIAQSHPHGQIIFLDEPTSAMDLQHVHQSMSLLQSIAHRQNRAVFAVLQDINLAARYADIIWLLEQGELIAADKWQNVLTPQNLNPLYKITATPLPPNPAAPHQRPIFDITLPPTETH